ncbi:MAG: hypothetical protein K8I29_19550 [Alphaproteobacteria bacterium]|uniref:Uncharacterized protein n=1 Tax=Candidatus Nitrobium versatile TaxID=2884831 RepID=A0A953SIE4_9BACT|nr:hypothetical protein [Candidatus Nitrobium versatile]
MTRDQVHANVAGTGLAQHADGSLKLATARIFAIGTTEAANDATGTIAITATGVLATDVVVVTLRASTNVVYVLKAVPTPDTITVTLSGAGGAGTQVDYVVLRAVA